MLAFAQHIHYLEEATVPSFPEIFMRALAHEEERLPLRTMLNRDWSALWQLREHLIDRARSAAQKRGRSYRDFQVGAAAFMSSSKPELLRSLGRPSNTIYTGSNWKLGKDERNTCAEQEIVAQLRQQQHLFPTDKVMTLVIAGESQDEPDAESGVTTPTLHPCRHCRKLLSEVPAMKPDSIIITVGLTTDTTEIMSFQSLLRIHSPHKESPS